MSKRYKLITKPETHNLSVTCACGKCNPEITISESAKEEFKELMGWDEVDFKQRTIEIKDVKE